MHAYWRPSVRTFSGCQKQLQSSLEHVRRNPVSTQVNIITPIDLNGARISPPALLKLLAVPKGARWWPRPGSNSIPHPPAKLAGINACCAAAISKYSYNSFQSSQCGHALLSMQSYAFKAQVNQAKPMMIDTSFPPCQLVFSQYLLIPHWNDAHIALKKNRWFQENYVHHWLFSPLEQSKDVNCWLFH